MANCYKFGGLKQEKFILSQSGGLKSEIVVLAGLVPPGVSEGESFLASLPASGGSWQPLAFLGS